MGRREGGSVPAVAGDGAAMVACCAVHLLVLAGVLAGVSGVAVGGLEAAAGVTARRRCVGRGAATPPRQPFAGGRRGEGVTTPCQGGAEILAGRIRGTADRLALNSGAGTGHIAVRRSLVAAKKRSKATSCTELG